jgi:[acyl-carrier-protein] S-malonyltransferase
LSISAPRLKYLSAVDASEHGDAEDIRTLLGRQLASPVRWSATVLALTARGATQLVECGPGKVLTALNRRIERRPEISCLALEDPAAIHAALAATSGNSQEQS